MDEQREDQQDDTAAPSMWHLTREQLTLASGTMLAATGVDLLAHLGATGLVVGGILAFAAARHGQGLYRQVQGLLSPAPAPPPPHSHPGKQSKRSVLDCALSRFPDTPEEEGPLLLAEEQEDPPVPEGNLLSQRQQVPQAGGSLPRRLTIDEIVAHVEPNSYRICLGRSLTKPGAPAVFVSFKGRHLKLIGASQYGKSSMAAALIEIITRTHSTEHVLVALLDLEDQTSRLFADLPHVAEILTEHGPLLLHARTPEAVLTCLRALVQLIHLRYSLSKTDLLTEPIVLVYLEEFLALKDCFKLRIEAVSRDEREQARRDYASLVFCIKEIARRGLKVRVQLLLCAQVDYRDEDLQEALINVTAGMSFCVRVSAAQAAGFYHTDLLARNARDDQKGQMVVEMPDCKDLVLAPFYDLERRLLARERQELQAAQRSGQRQGHRPQVIPFLTPAHGHHSLGTPQPAPAPQAIIPPISSVSREGNGGNAQGNALETAPQGGAVTSIRDVFPVSHQDAPQREGSTHGGQGPVSQETLETIRRMKAARLPDREIAQWVGLAGRKYGAYRSALVRLGYAKAAEAEGGTDT